MGNITTRRRLGADIVSKGMRQVCQRFTIGGVPAVIKATTTGQTVLATVDGTGTDTPSMTDQPVTNNT